MIFMVFTGLKKNYLMSVMKHRSKFVLFYVLYIMTPCVILSLMVRVKNTGTEKQKKNIFLSNCVFYWYCKSNILSRGILGLHVITQ